MSWHTKEAGDHTCPPGTTGDERMGTVPGRETRAVAPIEIALVSLLLLIAFSLQVRSARLKSPTYDEPSYITCGYAFVRLGDLHILVGEPILLNALNALPLLPLNPRFPTEHPSWAGTDFHIISEQFLWYANDNADQLVFAARVPTMLLTSLLITFVYRWGREMFGPWGGMLAATLAAFDPNLLAHGRLAATDLGSTTFIFIASYWLWRLLRRPTWRHVLIAGAFVGLAQSSRFSALLFGPGWALAILWRAFTPRPFALPSLRHPGDGSRSPPRWRRLVQAAGVGTMVVLVAYLTIWAVHGFEVGPVKGLTSFPVLAPSYFDELMYILPRLRGAEGRQVVGFLRGELYVGGRWDYFPVAFACKTPLPTLILLLGSALLSLRKRFAPDGQMLWLPPLLYFTITLHSKINLGYRYILPVLPFAIVIAARAGVWLLATAGASGRWTTPQAGRERNGNTPPLQPRRCAWDAYRRRRWPGIALTAALVVWAMWDGIAIYPHYLAFFNALAGGPDNGWRVLVDSNVDWGQDIKGLKKWMDEHGVERIRLGFVGEAHPTHYGIKFDPLPSSPDRWQHPLHHDIYYADPAPGLYAISANLIQGRNLADPDTYRWFRERKPIDKIGYSIFIYDVPPRGEGRAVIALSGLVPADIRPTDYARLGTNDVRVLWFDAAHALVAPSDGARVYIFLAGDASPPPELSDLWPTEGWETTTRDGRRLRIMVGNPRPQVMERIAELAADAPLWRTTATSLVPGGSTAHGELLAYPLPFDDRIEMLAYAYDRATPDPGGELAVTTFWRVRRPPQVLRPISEPLRLFVHLLDAQGNYVSGEDRLDVWYDNWRKGDLIVQVQRVRVPANTSPGDYQVELGWYDPATMERLPVLSESTPIANRVLLRPVKVKITDTQ